jgi:hypothetical protein
MQPFLTGSYWPIAAGYDVPKYAFSLPIVVTNRAVKSDAIGGETDCKRTDQR